MSSLNISLFIKNVCFEKVLLQILIKNFFLFFFSEKNTKFDENFGIAKVNTVKHSSLHEEHSSNELLSLS